MKRFICALTLVFVLACPASAAQNVYISDQGGSHVGYCQDAGLGSGLGADLNYGGTPNWYMGQNALNVVFREITRWDLSMIPDHATILTAKIVMYCNTVTGGGETITVYQIAAANNDWVEGTSNNASEVGAACWNKRIYNTTNWAGSAGLSTAGTDYVNASLGSVSITSTGPWEIVLNATGIAAIQNRLASDDIELFLRSSPGGTSDIIYLDSSESVTTAQRPYLYITYSVPQVVIIICE